MDDMVYDKVNADATTSKMNKPSSEEVYYEPMGVVKADVENSNSNKDSSQALKENYLQEGKVKALGQVENPVKSKQSATGRSMTIFILACLFILFLISLAALVLGIVTFIRVQRQSGANTIIERTEPTGYNELDLQGFNETLLNEIEMIKSQVNCTLVTFLKLFNDTDCTV